MLNPQAKISNLKSYIPTVLPLSDAARKYNLTEQALTQLIQTGKIEAFQLPTGELLVAAESNGQEPRTKEEIIAKEFAHLRRQRITVTDSAQKYEMHHNTILEWVKKGYINPLKKQGGRGSRMELDESEVAYCAKIHRERGGKRGVRLFDEYGNPYQLKRPQLAEYRRRKKHTEKEV